MANKSFDIAVLGLGTMGTFACLEAAKRRLSVVGFDQFAPPHERGSHTGGTRVFRTAYAEHADYVPLARRAGILWDQMGHEFGVRLLHRTGMLSVGPADSALISGMRASSAAHNLYIKNLSRDDVAARFPAFELPAKWEGCFEPDAGWLDVDASLRLGLEQASRRGADLRIETPVQAWEATGEGFAIRTAARTFHAQRLIITAGAWAGQLLADLQLPLRVIRKVLVWLHPLRPEHFSIDRFPVFASAPQFFYGIPDVDGAGVKLSIHWSEGSDSVPLDVRQPPATRDEIEAVLMAARSLLPSLAGPLPDAFDRVLKSKTCLYTMTPDEHFIVDRHPAHRHVILAAGFSGHGYKFAPAIGEALAELAVDGRTTLPIGFLGLQRFNARTLSS